MYRRGRENPAGGPPGRSLILALSPATAGAATRSVTMDNSRVFQPPVITIARGDTVRWSVASNANTTHDVSSTGVHHYFQSPGGQGGLHHGQSYSFQFTSAGSFPYVCRIHVQDGMYGTVTVPGERREGPGLQPSALQGHRGQRRSRGDVAVHPRGAGRRPHGRTPLAHLREDEACERAVYAGGSRCVHIPLMAHRGRRQPVQPDAGSLHHVLTPGLGTRKPATPR